MRLVIRSLAFFTTWICSCVSLYAQSDTALWLSEIEVTATRIDLTGIGKHSDDIDTMPLARLPYAHLASMLQANTPLYVRSYGNGTLATLGIRGGSAAHTQLMWNGIPIRNPMIGLVDLSLIPSAIVDEAAIHYGGHGAAFGSGAIGGLISFANDALTGRESATLHVYGGSWHEQGANIKLTYGKNKLGLGTRLFSHFAKNDFSYKLNEVLPERKQSNHRLTDVGLLQEIQWTVNDRNALTGRVWWQVTERQIPPTSVQTTSKAAQQDQAIRTSLQWKHAGVKWNWQLKAAMLDETIDFQDSLILLYTNNQFRTWIAEYEVTDRFTDALDMAAGVSTEHVEATSGNYEGINTRNQQAAYASFRLTSPAWLWRLQFREELTDEAWSPLLMDLSTEWRAIEGVTWKASISRNYRVPTLNDLHWQPGGNPDLVPEKGWTMESGLHLETKPGFIKANVSCTGYIRNLNQWIMWMPPVKGVRTYWSPINVTSVRSRGVEVRGDVAMVRRNFSWQLKTGVDLTWSTFEEDLPDFGIETGDQLFYVPVDNIMAGLQLNMAGWSLKYDHHWFGDSPGINEMVAAGDVASFSTAYAWEKLRTPLTLYMQVDNVWNVPYRLIERRPMPSRSIELGLRLSI